MTIALGIEILARMGACSMRPKIFTDLFLRSSFLEVVFVKFFLNVYTASWSDSMSSNIYNYTVSFAQIFALATGATSVAGDGIYSLYI